MTFHTLLPGQENLFTTPLADVDPLILSDTILSSSHFKLARKIGRSFGIRNGVDVELYEAEAAYVMVLIHRGFYEVANIQQVRRRIYKELWRYYYADRVVAAKSTSTIWRGNLPKANEDATMVMVGDDTISLMELIDEVTVETREKEYIRLVMEGKSVDEIKVALDIGDRVLADIRSRIVKRVKESKSGKIQKKEVTTDWVP